MDTNTRHAVVTTSIGDITLVASGDTLIGVYFPKHWTKPDARAFGLNVSASSDPLLAEAERQLDEYLHGTRTSFDLPVATRGDAFQEQIWSLIEEIPFGETATYGELAEQYGRSNPGARCRQAVGSNPLAVIVPCHRVVGKDGKLVGMRAGLERKRALLRPRRGRHRHDDHQAAHAGRDLDVCRTAAMKQPFEQVVAEHGETVLRVCRVVVGVVDANDAWSETFLSALRAYPDLPADANVQAWLVTIAHRKAIDIIRSRQRQGSRSMTRRNSRRRAIYPDRSTSISGTR